MIELEDINAQKSCAFIFMCQQNITLIQVMKHVFIIQQHITTTICLQQLKSTFDERKLAEIKVLKE